VPIEQLDAELTLALAIDFESAGCAMCSFSAARVNLALLGDRDEVEHLASPEWHRSLAARSPRRT